VWDQKKKKTGKRSQGKSKRCAPLLMPNALSGELSEYEKAREDNIKVRALLLFFHFFPVMLMQINFFASGSDFQD